MLNILRSLLLLVLVLPLLGCSRNHYTVLERKESKTHKLVSVEVPVRTTKSDMKVWGQEIQEAEKVKGKSINIFFFADLPDKPHTQMGAYSNGVVQVYVDVF